MPNMFSLYPTMWRIIDPSLHGHPLLSKPVVPWLEGVHMLNWVKTEKEVTETVFGDSQKFVMRNHNVGKLIIHLAIMMPPGGPHTLSVLNDSKYCILMHHPNILMDQKNVGVFFWIIAPPFMCIELPLPLPPFAAKAMAAAKASRAAKALEQAQQAMKTAQEALDQAEGAYALAEEMMDETGKMSSRKLTKVQDKEDELGDQAKALKEAYEKKIEAEKKQREAEANYKAYKKEKEAYDEAKETYKLEMAEHEYDEAEIEREANKKLTDLDSADKALDKDIDRAKQRRKEDQKAARRNQREAKKKQRESRDAFAREEQHTENRKGLEKQRQEIPEHKEDDQSETAKRDRDRRSELDKKIAEEKDAEQKAARKGVEAVVEGEKHQHKAAQHKKKADDAGDEITEKREQKSDNEKTREKVKRDRDDKKEDAEIAKRVSKGEKNEAKEKKKQAKKAASASKNFSMIAPSLVAVAPLFTTVEIFISWAALGGVWLKALAVMAADILQAVVGVIGDCIKIEFVADFVTGILGAGPNFLRQWGTKDKLEVKIEFKLGKKNGGEIKYDGDDDQWTWKAKGEFSKGPLEIKADAGGELTGKDGREADHLTSYGASGKVTGGPAELGGGYSHTEEYDKEGNKTTTDEFSGKAGTKDGELKSDDEKLEVDGASVSHKESSSVTTDSDGNVLKDSESSETSVKYGDAAEVNNSSSTETTYGQDGEVTSVTESKKSSGSAGSFAEESSTSSTTTDYGSDGQVTKRTQTESSSSENAFTQNTSDSSTRTVNEYDGDGNITKTTKTASDGTTSVLDYTSNVPSL